MRSERSSVIENWEVVRSSEARNVLKLCKNSIGFVRYIEAAIFFGHAQ